MKIIKIINRSIMVSALALSSIATADNRRMVNVAGVPATGPNQFCGQPLWSFENQDIEPLSFRQVGIFNGSGDVPSILDAQNCNRTQLLATIHDPILSFDPPGPAPAIVQQPDPRLENIPLREVPRTVGLLNGGGDGIRTQLEQFGQVPANPFPVFLSEPSEPITLGEWASANGQLRYRCRADGTAILRGNFRNLIGNGVYSVWGIWRTALPGGGPTISVPVPLGGIPNAIVPNERGSARFRRELPFCPSSETADGSLLLWVAVAYHSDSAIYGGVPEETNMVRRFVDVDGTEFESTSSLLVHHEQLVFPINVTSSNPDVIPLIKNNRKKY